MSSPYDSHKDYKSFSDYFSEYYDMETGEPYIPTQAHKEARERLQERMRKFINPDGLTKGTILIASTVADDTKSDDYRNLWNELKSDNT